MNNKFDSTLVILLISVAFGVGLLGGAKIEDWCLSQQTQQILEKNKEIEAELDSLKTKIEKVEQNAYYQGLLQAFSMEYINDIRSDERYWRFIDTLVTHHINSKVVGDAFKSVQKSLDRALNDDQDISPERYKELTEKAIELKKKVLEKLGRQKDS